MSIVKYHIRNRASTVEIAPPTFEIALQHSKSRFNSRNRNSTFEIALRHSRRFEFRAESWRSVFVPGVSCAGNAQIPFKSSNYPRSSFRAESFLKIDFSRTQPEIQSASLHHSKSRFNIRNRTFTFEIAPPTFEITLQHSKSRFNTRNHATTLGIALPTPRNALPTPRNALPALGNTYPALGNTFPALGNPNSIKFRDSNCFDP